MVICGGNGCGKSALLNALMTAKENAAPYGNFQIDPRLVSADCEKAVINLHIVFNEIEQEWYKEKYNQNCPESDEIVVEIDNKGRARTKKTSRYTGALLSNYSRKYEKSPGFFDYIDAFRSTNNKKQLSTWNPTTLNDNHFKQTLSISGIGKFLQTKEYLASLVMHDLQHIQTSQKNGILEYPDSLKDIKSFFNSFFAPLKFHEVRIDKSPFEFSIKTPRGLIDIDDLSAGEKEVFNVYVRFHQLRPTGAVILFDEADAHLHPDLERKYLHLLKELGEGNQIWLTTHSPEMMIAAGHDNLFTIIKEPSAGENQFVQVTSSESLYNSLSEIMGSRGLISFNQRIVFIEGKESSADREIYEKFFPANQYLVSFVPAGDSGVVRKTAERVNELLSSSIGFQHYYSIVDGDIERFIQAPINDRLFKLPVYHVENFLLNNQAILKATHDLLGKTSPFTNENDVEKMLRELLYDDAHLKPFTKALYDSKIAKIAKQAYDNIYKKTFFNPPHIDFADTENEAKVMLENALNDNSWRKICKGRDLIKALSYKLAIKYEHLRNDIIANIMETPNELREIMQRIMQ